MNVNSTSKASPEIDFFKHLFVSCRWRKILSSDLHLHLHLHLRRRLVFRQASVRRRGLVLRLHPHREGQSVEKKGRKPKGTGPVLPPPSRPSSDRIPIVHTYSTTSYDIIPLIRYLIYSVQFIVTAHVTACHVYIFWKIYISCKVEDVVAATFFFPKLGLRP